MEVSKILIVGDTHGDAKRNTELNRVAVAEGCTLVLQLGDFGWFPNYDGGSSYIQRVASMAEASGVTWCFIGGNHDNWDSLDEITADYDRDENGFVVIGEYLRYIPRPYRWEWGGVRFAAVGGAWSIDRKWRTSGINWWPQEQPSYSDFRNLLEGGKIDILLAHDVPGEVDMSVAGWGGNDIGGGEDVRRNLDMIVSECEVDRLWHGHWHHRHTTTLAAGCVVDGFGDNNGPLTSQYGVYDIEVADLWPQREPMPLRTPWWQP